MAPSDHVIEQKTTRIKRMQVGSAKIWDSVNADYYLVVLLLHGTLVSNNILVKILVNKKHNQKMF